MLQTIGETQKFSQDIQEAHSKREILQQNPLFKVPKKLFIESDELDRNDTDESMPMSQKVPNEDENLCSEAPELVVRKKPETRLSINNTSLSKKLFSGDTEDDMNTDVDLEVETEKTNNNSQEIVLNFTETETESSKIRETPNVRNKMESSELTRNHTELLMDFDDENSLPDDTFLRLNTENLKDLTESELEKNFVTPEPNRPNYITAPPDLDLDRPNYFDAPPDDKDDEEVKKKIFLIFSNNMGFLSFRKEFNLNIL